MAAIAAFLIFVLLATSMLVTENGGSASHIILFPAKAVQLAETPRNQCLSVSRPFFSIQRVGGDGNESGANRVGNNHKNDGDGKPVRWFAEALEGKQRLRTQDANTPAGWNSCCASAPRPSTN
jgi:hypothetical protein